MSNKITTNIIEDAQALRAAANNAYLAFSASIEFAPKTPEFERLRYVNRELRASITRMSNGLTAAMPSDIDAGELATTPGYNC